MLQNVTEFSVYMALFLCKTKSLYSWVSFGVVILNFEVIE
jgi:hypothetical protein